MGILTVLAGFPVTGPVSGLGWIARQVAEAAEREMNDPARIEKLLLALERALEAGEIDEPAFEAREAELLAELDSLGASPAAMTHAPVPWHPANAAPAPVVERRNAQLETGSLREGSLPKGPQG